MKSAADSPRVLGLDPSLTNFGYAAGLRTSGTLTTRTTGMERLGYFWRQVKELVQEHRPDLVVIEGYSFASGFRAAHMGELGGTIRLGLYSIGVEYLDVPPSTLKILATGKGNAAKELVLVEAVKRLEYSGSSNDVADSLWLWELGRQLLGCGSIELPKTHLRALDKLERPYLAVKA